MNKFITRKVRFLSIFLVLVFSLVVIFPSQTYAGVEWARKGTQVHAAVTNKFYVDNFQRGEVFNSGKVIRGTGGPYGKSALKPDFICELYINNTTEIYELKPISYSLGSKHSKALKQINNYIGAYSFAYPSRIAIRGRVWNPDGQIVNVDSNTSVVLFTRGYLDAGIVYYDFFQNEDPDPEYYVKPYEAKDSEGRKVTVFAQNKKVGLVLATIAVAGGVAIIIGTVAEDIITAGAGIADDPATLLAAEELIRYGLKYAN